MIKIESLSKAFNGKSVVKNLDLEVQQKETLALIGPNGCGKTTLLNMIAGLLRPDCGNIYINNKMVYGVLGVKKVNLGPFEREIGYVFQNLALLPHMRIQDNIAYGLKSLNLSKVEVKKRTHKLLEFVNLTEYALAYPNQLSGGQQQRIALARSLAVEPRIMLLDEPVHAIDSQLRETFLSELKKYLQTIETTTIYVTHNLDEAFRMTNKVAVMENGHIKQVGDRTEIFNKTQTTFVAKILGMNIFKGKIIKEQNKHSLIDINNITLWTTSKAKHSKENITIAINPEDITISTEKTNTPKATNNIPGVITEMVQMHSITQITVDIGFPVKARATNTEIKNLGITSGDKIYATFDPAKINIFSENT